MEANGDRMQSAPTGIGSEEEEDISAKIVTSIDDLD